MKTFKIYLIIILLISCIMTCWGQEIEMQIDYGGPTLFTLGVIPDSLKTTEQKELYLKLLRVIHANLQFKGDSVFFLLDKARFLSEGLPESAYLHYMDYLEFANSDTSLLSHDATINAAYRKHFGFEEYSGDTPLLEFVMEYNPDSEIPVIGVIYRLDIQPIPFPDSLADVDEETMNAMVSIWKLPEFWDAMFDETKPFIEVNPQYKIYYAINGNSEVSPNNVLVEDYLKKEDKKIFIEQIIKIWKDYPSKYIRVFFETIDNDTVKALYMVSDD